MSWKRGCEHGGKKEDLNARARGSGRGGAFRDELKAVSEGEPVESAVHKKRTVVVAEDESVNRMDLVAMLEDNGYEVVGEAANGEEPSI